MIHFQHPALLYLLLVIPALVVCWILMRHIGRRRLEQFADRNMFHRLIPDASRWRPAAKFALVMLAAALVVVAMANPQMGSKRAKGEHIGSDQANSLDISNSMMAEDIQPNRLERAKRMVSKLLEHMAGDRVSLIVFAGTSYIQMPLTNDYSATKLFLDQIDCSLIDAQGTAIGDALGKAMQSFGYGDSDREWEKGKGRAIIIISDGENHEDDATKAAKDAADEGVMVCTIGMGLPDGTPIPQYDKAGHKTGFKHDRDGNTVTTHLNEQMLIDIARAGDGTYLRGGSINASLNPLFNTLDKLEKEHYGETQFDEYESQYQYPLFAALLCLLIEMLIFERRNKKVRISFVVALMLLPSVVQGQSQEARSGLRKGNRLYNKEQFDQAETHFRRSLQNDSTYFRGQYNLGNALYRQKNYDQAARHYSKALESDKLGEKERSKSLHNMGNSHLKMGLQDRTQGLEHFQQAVNCYKEALKIDPTNDDTRYNLSYARKLLLQSQQQQNNQNNQGGGQNQQQQNQQQQQNDKNKQDNQQDQQQQQNSQQQDKKQNSQQQDQQQRQQGDKKENKENAGEREQKKRDAERLLNAMENNERQSLKEHQGKIETGRPRRIEKDW